MEDYKKYGAAASSSSKNKEEKIILTRLNGTGYVFNADDCIEIRKQHRIVGCFVGTQSHKGHSVKNQTLPVEYNQYETQLLLEEGIAILVSKTKAFSKELPTEEVNKLKAAYEQSIEDQISPLNERKLEESVRNIKKVMQGKRKKLLKLGVPEEDIKLTEEEVIQEMKDNIKFDRSNALLDIPNECIFNHEAEIVEFSIDDPIRGVTLAFYFRERNYMSIFFV